MPLYVLTCIDTPNSLDQRMALREAHLAYVRGSGVCKIGGPFTDEAGSPVGSMLIIEAADLAAAQAFADNDPYAQAGLFQTAEVRPFKVTLGSL